MKGKIVDVHPVALHPQKNGRLLTQKTVSEKERETRKDARPWEEKWGENIQVKRFKGQEHQE